MKKYVATAIVFALMAAAPVTDANEVHKQLQARSEAERNRLLTVLLAQSHKVCGGGVTKSYFQGLDSKDDSAFWNVRCGDNRAYNIMIMNDAVGSTRILECEVLAALGIPCWQPID